MRRIAVRRRRKIKKGKKLYVELDLTLDRLESEFDVARQKGSPRLLVFQCGIEIEISMVSHADLIHPEIGAYLHSRSGSTFLFGLDTADSFSDQIDRLGPTIKFV
ncbi:MAG: hypothetical protein HYT48_01435 [Candidatus Vogelbacteria bacterium]|nr:hypothetical protein [Candidatus Vogelbacteria bacterium]